MIYLFTLIPFVLLPLIIMSLIFLLPKYLKFNESQYKTETENSFFKTVFDKGLYGEFLTFLELEKLKIHKKILANTYVPKEDGKTKQAHIEGINKG